MQAKRVGQRFAFFNLRMCIQNGFFQTHVLRLGCQHGQGGINGNTRTDNTDELSAENAQVTCFDTVQEGKVDIFGQNSLFLQLNGCKVTAFQKRAGLLKILGLDTSFFNFSKVSSLSTFGIKTKKKFFFKESEKLLKDSRSKRLILFLFTLPPCFFETAYPTFNSLAGKYTRVREEENILFPLLKTKLQSFSFFNL
jgi:hypothetical protein